MASASAVTGSAKEAGGGGHRVHPTPYDRLIPNPPSRNRPTSFMNCSQRRSGMSPGGRSGSSRAKAVRPFRDAPPSYSTIAARSSSASPWPVPLPVSAPPHSRLDPFRSAPAGTASLPLSPFSCRCQ